MSNRVPFLAVSLALVVGITPPGALSAQTTAELDAFWAAMAQTVEDGDFDGYAALYHPDAVLVSTGEGTSYPIAQALDGWRQLFVDTQTGAATASVTFRWTRRLHDGTTAHETGIFHYRFAQANGQVSENYTHFQALLVKKDGWKMVMEYQQRPATMEEWEALR